MSNSVNLSLDVTKTGIQNPLIKVRQGDGGFETLHTTVTSNGEPLDLQGWTITFMGTTAGNHKIVDGNVKIVEAPNGIFDYTPSKAWGMDIGDFKMAYFKFVKGDGSASSANFRVSVIEAVDLTQEEAQNYISVVDTTIAEINQRLNDSLASVTQSIADANNNANTVSGNVTALGKRVDDYNNKLAAIQVGGRNYLLNSQSLNIKTLNNSAMFEKIPYDANTNMWHITSPSGNGANVGFFFKQTNNTSKAIEAGQQWGFSFDIKGTGVYSDKHIGVEGSNPFNSPTGSVPSSWTRVSANGISNGSDTIIVYFNTTSSALDVYIKLPKLEIGNVPTDWTPAPEDAPSNDAQLVHKTGTETIAGDKTFTSPINGQLSGNAATATKWQTARTLALTGDVSGSVAMDGSGNVSMATTGANLVHKTGTETIAGDKTFTGVTNIQNQKQYKASFTIGANTINLTRIGSIVYVNARTNEKINAGASYGVIPAGFTPANSAVINFIVNNTQGSCLFQSNQNNVWFPEDAPFDSNMSGSYLTSDALPS